jgi:hypothetical protein
MKGTLFSADFIKDADANLRLLELNTDSGFISNTLSSRFNFADFISILQSNNITELVLIYKNFQKEFIDTLKLAIANDATFITTVTEQEEATNTIYPTAVTDSSEKFILRLAYDENALLDSTYCKDRANLQKLFYDNSATGSIPEFYYSGSEYEVSTLRSTINDHSSLPDFVSKPKVEEHSALTFYNVGGSDSSSVDRTSDLISNKHIDYNNTTIEKYHYNADDIAADNKVSGYRVVGIVYGESIEYVTIGEWKVKSFLEIPTISETTYITNNEALSAILEDFETTVDSSMLIPGGTLTPTQEVFSGKNCMKVVINADGNTWQNSQLSFTNGDVDLTTDDKLIQVDVYSDFSTSILAKVVLQRGSGEESAANAAHGGTGWETLDFNFANPVDSTAVANDIYGGISFFPLWNGSGFDNAEVAFIQNKTTTYYTNIKGLEDKSSVHLTSFLQDYEHKHYFQLTSNWIRTTNGDGVFTGTDILNVDNTSVKVETIETGSVVKSIFINGLPDGDYDAMYRNWSSAGTGLPDGTIITSSVVEIVTELNSKAEYGTIGEITLSDNEAIYTSIGKNLLIYNTGSNAMSFKNQYNIEASKDFLINPSGSLIPIISNKIVVLEPEEHDLLYQIDVETTDTYFVSSSLSPFIVHNCFVAGTLVKLLDGTDIVIEEVNVGDEILTYNVELGKNEKGIVGDLKKHTVDSVIRLTLDNENIILTTSEHPFYVEGKWITASKLQPLDVCLKSDGSESIISTVEVLEESHEVFNLLNVEPTHTFYVNGILVHNKEFIPETCFAAGTHISLSNGDVKNIEDIVVGDEVLGWDGKKIDSAVVIATDDSHFVGSHAAACKLLGDEPSLYTIDDTGIEFTPEHPFLTKDGWKSLVPDKNQEPYLSNKEPKILEVGDSICIDSEWKEIEDIRIVRSDAKEKVYNITVDRLHSYVANGIIVHNK